MQKFRINADGAQVDRDMELIRGFISEHKIMAAKMARLWRYYRGDHDAIMDKVVTDKQVAPNNKVVNPYPSYIVDTQVGYFMGSPIVYTYNDEDLEERMSVINEYNDEQAHNIDLARSASVCGVAYEVLYFDTDKNIRFTSLPSEQTFLIYDTTLEDNVLYGVRYYEERLGDEKQTVLIIYTDHEVITFELSGDDLVERERRSHAFSEVPINMYRNNAEEMGDFEKVIPLIDAYDRVESNTLDDMDMFTDAYLHLKNLAGTDENNIRQMRETRTILTVDDGDASWLVKTVNDTWVENFKTRLDADIHKFSFTPNMADTNFASNQSGVAIRYKLLGMEQLRSIKERQFKKGLQRRVELICNHLGFLGAGQFNYLDVLARFNDSLPQNIMELSQVANALREMLSDETLLSLLPFVEDPASELEKRKAEREERGNQSFLKFSGNPFSGGLNDEEENTQ